MIQYFYIGLAGYPILPGWSRQIRQILYKYLFGVPISQPDRPFNIKWMVDWIRWILSQYLFGAFGSDGYDLDIHSMYLSVSLMGHPIFSELCSQIRWI
jgi:hypothetical protein